MKLTKKVVSGAKYTGTNGARCFVWDDLPGFGLRVFPSGHKAYVLSYRTPAGRKRLMSLGSASVLNVDQARLKAKAELVRIEGHSADPLADKARQRVEAATGTIKTMVTAYIAGKSMRRPDVAEWCLTKHIEPTFGGRNWQEVKRSEIRDWYDGIASAASANRSLNLLKAAFGWRILQDDGDALTVRDVRNPCSGVTRKAEKARQVRVERSELPALEAAIDVEPNPYLRGLFHFILRTGCRKGEALGLRHADVRLAEPASVTFRDTKNGTDHTVPLTEEGVDILKAMPRVVGNPFVFCGEERAAIRNPHKAWVRIRDRAGLGHVTIHDLRRSVGSWLGDAGFTEKQIGVLLNHKSAVTGRVYMALGDEAKRKAVEKLEALRKGPAAG